MKHAVAAMTRLAWLRLWRGRSLWITGLLMLGPLLLAMLASWRIEPPDGRWSRIAEVTLRSLVLLAPTVHLAPSVGEEVEANTYSYLWSRPIPRESLIFGKLLAITPVLVVAAVITLCAAFMISSLGRGGADFGLLPPALLGGALGVVGASAFSVGIGALFPKHPLAVAIGYVLFAEQILPTVPAIKNLSMLTHAQVIAQLPLTAMDVEGSPTRSVVVLIVLTVAWIGIAVWRLRSVELSSAEG